MKYTHIYIYIYMYIHAQNTHTHTCACIRLYLDTTALKRGSCCQHGRPSPSKDNFLESCPITTTKEKLLKRHPPRLRSTTDKGPLPIKNNGTKLSTTPPQSPRSRLVNIEGKNESSAKTAVLQLNQILLSPGDGSSIKLMKLKFQSP